MFNVELQMVCCVERLIQWHQKRIPELFKWSSLWWAFTPFISVFLLRSFCPFLFSFQSFFPPSPIYNLIYLSNYWMNFVCSTRASSWFSYCCSFSTNFFSFIFCWKKKVFVRSRLNNSAFSNGFGDMCLLSFLSIKRMKWITHLKIRSKFKCVQLEYKTIGKPNNGTMSKNKRIWIDISSCLYFIIMYLQLMMCVCVLHSYSIFFFSIISFHVNNHITPNWFFNQSEWNAYNKK